MYVHVSVIENDVDVTGQNARTTSLAKLGTTLDKMIKEETAMARVAAARYGLPRDAYRVSVVVHDGGCTGHGCITELGPTGKRCYVHSEHRID